MNVEFQVDQDGHEILFAAEFPAPPRVGETVFFLGPTEGKYRVLEVTYGILDFKGRSVGAICTVEKVEEKLVKRNVR